MPTPAYHGTAAKNISSISSRGLLIPGHGDVRVAHGSAHGVGIYTAKLGSSMLSKGFCDSDKLFVCGVIDAKGEAATQCAFQRLSRHHRQHRKPAAWKSQPAPMMGRFMVHKESNLVRHVGSAMVVFDERNVAPLFVASGIIRHTVSRWRIPNRSQCLVSQASVTPQRELNAKSIAQGGFAMVGRHQALMQETNEIVWLPPDVEEKISAKKVKRRIEHKRKDIQRRADREEKLRSLLY